MYNQVNNDLYARIQKGRKVYFNMTFSHVSVVDVKLLLHKKIFHRNSIKFESNAIDASKAVKTNRENLTNIESKEYNESKIMT